MQAYMQVRVVHGPLDELHYAQRSICSHLEQQGAHRGRPLTDTILDLQTDAKLAWTCDAFVLGGARVVVANVRRHAWQTWIIHGGAIRVNHLDGEVQMWRGPPPEGSCLCHRELRLEVVLRQWCAKYHPDSGPLRKRPACCNLGWGTRDRGDDWSRPSNVWH